MTNIRWQHYAGIFLISMATLVLELALTRVLSVANWYHFGFLVISTALLGFGASGVTLSVWTKLRDQIPLVDCGEWQLEIRGTRLGSFRGSHLRTFLVFAVVVLSCTVQVPASTSYNFTSFDYPGATYTEADGINKAAIIVGFYTDLVSQACQVNGALDGGCGAETAIRLQAQSLEESWLDCRILRAAHEARKQRGALIEIRGKLRWRSRKVPCGIGDQVFRLTLPKLNGEQVE